MNQKSRKLMRDYMSSIIADCFFDIHQRLDSVSLRGLDGFNQDAVIEFGGGLNIIYGKSGSGRSRLIQWIVKQHGGSYMFVPQISEEEMLDKSFGEYLYGIADIIITLTPDNICTLIDDFLHHFDSVYRARFLTMLAESGNQIVLTADSAAMESIREILSDDAVTVIDIRGVVES